MHWMYGDPMGWGGWVAMTLGTLFWIALIALVVVGAMRWAKGPQTFQSSQPPEDRAIEILRQRYARGEISREEFERMRDELNVSR